MQQRVQSAASTFRQWSLRDAAAFFATPPHSSRRRRILLGAAAFFSTPPHSSRRRRILLDAAAFFALYKSSCPRSADFMALFEQHDCR
jgi:hypothetical protein